MLVLALQFSRCGIDACGTLTSSTQQRHRKIRTNVRLLQNGREDKCVVSHELVRPKPTNLPELGDEPTSAPTGMSRHRATIRSPTVWNGLLRKEVIQPHLPVRLPCYDFTPITDPTFDGSLSCELGHRLRVLPTFVV
jgi:hypothetical protein